MTENKMIQKETNPLFEEKNDVAVIQQPVAVDDEIDLGKLAGVLFERLHYIILCFVVGGLLFNLYAYLMIHPTYQSSAKLYMVSASEDSVVNFSDLNIGQALTSDYEELIFSYPVMDEVIEKMGLDMDSSGLAGMITIENPENTRVLVITTTARDAQLAMDITNTLVDVVRDYLPKTMSTTKPNVVQYGRLKPQRVGPSYMKYTFLGALIFAGVYCVIILAIYLMDDTIKGGEDLEREFGLVPLAMIPENDVYLEEESEYKKTLFGRRKKI